MSLLSAINLALFTPKLPDAARDDLAAAMGFVLRGTGLDHDDARARILRAASLLPDGVAANVREELTR